MKPRIDSLTLVYMVALLMLVAMSSFRVVQLQDQVTKYQKLYQEEQNVSASLEEDLEDAQAREAEALKRASRSRPIAPRVPAKPRPPAHSFGRVHDITMYCTGSITASGKTPRRGMVATLDRSIPFGTRIEIEGSGTFVVEDRIGHGSEFDLFTPSCAEAIRFGRQHRKVIIS